MPRFALLFPLGLSAGLLVGLIAGGLVLNLILGRKIDLEKAIADALEKVLAPVAEVICEMERIRRKEYLTEKEAALLFSLSAATLKTQRSRGGGPVHVKVGSRILYSLEALHRHIKSI